MQTEIKYFVGRRKNAVAAARVVKGTGNIFVNGRNANEYFKSNPDHVNTITEPFRKCSLVGKFDVIASIKGGGVTGQAEALVHAVSRSLASMDVALKKVLKKEGLLKRDPRVVERKKPGRAKARKRFQFSKR